MGFLPRCRAVNAETAEGGLTWSRALAGGGGGGGGGRGAVLSLAGSPRRTQAADRALLKSMKTPSCACGPVSGPVVGRGTPLRIGGWFGKVRGWAPLVLALLGPAVPAAHGAPVPEPPPYAPHAVSGTVGRVERLAPGLDDLVAPGTTVELLAEGFDWSEGPVWSTRGDCLLFADVPRNVVWRWREFEGLTEYLKPSGYTARPWSGGESGANGLTFDNDGRLILCQHGDRQVARLKGRTQLEPLATNFQGRRFNSPNDLVLHSSGEVYFTDPPYGLQGGTNDPKRELPYQGVFRISRRGRVSVVVGDLTFPNGIAFSPDERRLYVAVSDPQRAHYMAYDVQRDGTVGSGRVLFDATPLVAGRPGLPDGLKVDRKGNLWATGPGGVLVLTPEGRHLGTISTGDAIANCAWGDDGSVLYLTADSRLCRIRTRTRGDIPGPLPEVRP
jgi:gluconolactonase